MAIPAISTVTADMIKSFEISSSCTQGRCLHWTAIELKDGRKIDFELKGGQIFSIEQVLIFSENQSVINDPGGRDPSHFSKYGLSNLSADAILTRIFQEAIDDDACHSSLYWEVC